MTKKQRKKLQRAQQNQLQKGDPTQQVDYILQNQDWQTIDKEQLKGKRTLLIERTTNPKIGDIVLVNASQTGSSYYAFINKPDHWALSPNITQNKTQFAYYIWQAYYHPCTGLIQPNDEFASTTHLTSSTGTTKNTQWLKCEQTVGRPLAQSTLYRRPIRLKTHIFTTSSSKPSPTKPSPKPTPTCAPPQPRTDAIFIARTAWFAPSSESEADTPAITKSME